MKKIYFVLAVLATAMLASCVHEQSFSEYAPLGENDIAFVMKGASTRSGEGFSSRAVKGISIPVSASSQSFCLEETVEALNPAPSTKGAPAYTENIGTLYPNMDVYAPGNFGSVTLGVIDLYENPNGGDGWRYIHSYEVNPWPADKDEKVDFYLNMPASPSGVTFTKKGDKEIKFNYTSPSACGDQQDILFAQTSLSKNEHDGYLPKGAPVMMYHALSGVKFRNGHANNNPTKTIITNVEWHGLKSTGKCTITPASEGSDVMAVSWSEVADTTSFAQAYKNQAWSAAAGVDGTVTYTSGENNQFGNSWYSAANDRNLNEADGSLTFWFIPQEISADVTLDVTFRVKTQDTPNGTEIVRTLKIGQLLKAQNVEWKPGELRTYSLIPYDVDVEIEDSMTATEKSNVHITNTGNVDEYVRLLIMGNWYGWKPGTTESEMESTEPSILVGYKYQTEADAEAAGESFDTMVDPWYREGYDNDGDGVYEDPYGHFDNSFLLAKLGDRDGEMDNWADASGGFYYTAKIGPGQRYQTTDSATKNLFDSYTVTSVPPIYLPVGNTRQPAVGVHLVMEIVVQAIEVPKKKVTVDGEEVEKDIWWLEAWYEATKVDKLHPNAKKGTAYRNQKYRLHFIAGDYGDVVYDKYPVPEQ